MANEVMKPKSFMVIAGETSGDMLAVEMVDALRKELASADLSTSADCQPLYANLEPRFFGAGGPRMAASGVELALNMTAHAVTGWSEALKNYLKFRRFFQQLFRLALERQPEAVICVDFSGFNRRFARAIKRYTRARADWFHDWDPKVIQYVSPQVWASREGRASQIARDYDLLLSIFPFEKAWYAKRVPEFRVEFVGHPILDRYDRFRATGAERREPGRPPGVLLLPGSRRDELTHHLPLMIGALKKIRAGLPNVRVSMVLPDNTFVSQAKAIGLPAGLEIRTGGLPEALTGTDIAIASTGTVTMECAYFGVPTVALYKTSWSTWQIARHIVKVDYAAMPNLLANEQILPEFIQDAATAENIASAALEFLRDENQRSKVKSRLAEIIAMLGGPGANRRAARAIIKLLAGKASRNRQARGRSPFKLPLAS